MSAPKSAAFVDYQQRAAEFSVGDLVYPFMSGNQDLVGRVQAVWPAIGMVDVEWPHGSERLPVEDLEKHYSEEYHPPAVGNDNVPGGTGTVSVPGGPTSPEPPPTHPIEAPSAARVAAAYLKKALYWAAPDRHYRATQSEIDGDAFQCPRCKDALLVSTTYKRAEGISDRLLACPNCLFLIKRCDIIGHPEYEDDGQPGVQAGKTSDTLRDRLTCTGGN